MKATKIMTVAAMMMIIHRKNVQDMKKTRISMCLQRRMTTNLHLIKISSLFSRKDSFDFRLFSQFGRKWK